ncbi:hypothetical protein [Microcystis phage Mel-JY01]
MPKINEKYVNPFYQEVDGFVRSELNARAEYYGRKVRGVGKSFPTNVYWSYGKTAWARVISKTNPSIKLGFPGSKIMSDRNGKLTLYNVERNVPNKPLLTGLEISNEGTIGSLLKGKFSFIIYPKVTQYGFDLGALEEAFFTPGNEVEVSWGWSVAASQKKANTQAFTGIIYNFDWQFNTDLSVTANVSIVSAAGVSLGQSGDQSVKASTDTETPVDPLGSEVRGTNLITVIDGDLAAITGSKQMSVGSKDVIPKENTVNKLLDYVCIGLPFQEQAETENKGTPAGSVPPPVQKTFWYVKLGAVTEFANELVRRFEDTGSAVFSQLYEIRSYGNETDYNELLKSAYPVDVYFPDPVMGSYGPSCSPFTESELTKDINDGVVTPGTINIGNILLGTDYIKSVYKQFIEENATNIPYKNITKFIEELIKRINVATGDIYQLSAQLYEAIPTSDRIDSNPSSTDKAYLSIEDTNLSKIHTEKVVPYKFDATIFKPLIKNISISSKPPGPLATAAYAQARGAKQPRGGDAELSKVKPSNSDVSTAKYSEKDVDAFAQEQKAAEDGINKMTTEAVASGFSENWGERFRGDLTKLKRSKATGNGTHWLNKAIYPVDLTLTIDGIAGFKFGDVISTSTIPKHYNLTYDMVFTITKISHTIKDGVWETVLNTKSRISMDE